MKVTARVAAYLDAEPTAQAKAIHDRPLDEKPYWDLERARIGKTRKVPVEVIVNGHPVARREIAADGAFGDVSFDVPIKKSSWVALRVLPSVAHQPDLRARRRQADPRLEEVGRVVPEERRPVLVAERAGDPGQRERRGQEGVRRGAGRRTARSATNRPAIREVSR